MKAQFIYETNADRNLAENDSRLFIDWGDKDQLILRIPGYPKVTAHLLPKRLNLYCDASERGPIEEALRRILPTSPGTELRLELVRERTFPTNADLAGLQTLSDLRAQLDQRNTQVWNMLFPSSPLPGY